MSLSWSLCRELEQVAMDKLVELAYKKLLVVSSFFAIFYLLIYEVILAVYFTVDGCYYTFYWQVKHSVELT